MSEIVLEKPTRIRIMVANVNIAVIACLIVWMFKGFAAGFFAAVVIYMFLTFFLFEILDARR